MFKVRNVTKKYRDDGQALFSLENINFEVKTGEVVCILGQSGSGKSTLLRLLAGLEEIDDGKIERDDDASFSYVSQAYTLWPHLTVLENLTLAPSLEKKANLGVIRKEALDLLKRFELEDYAHAFPTTLSGGQQQRVALLRAVLKKPKILFLDEVTSALDPELTKSVLDLVRALSKDGYTMLIVTHHMSFALSVADRILFLQNGNLVADERSAQFFMNQKNEQIRSFILDIAKRDESIEVFRGKEQFQAYHLGLMRSLPEGTVIHVAGAVGDEWVKPMADLYTHYEELRIQKKIIWKMVTYEQGEVDVRLQKEHPELNQFRKMPRQIQNPANYNVFLDTVITQIFEDEPTIIQVKNKSIAEAYLRFFEELWESAK
jgi:polar amino acid transport system ATP-binding protein